MSTMPDDIQKLLAQYQSSGPESQTGIPTALFQYAQAHPELGIDRSGYNLAPTDPQFNFYNPTPQQTPGVDWWFADDRNNQNLLGQALAAPATASTTAPIAPNVQNLMQSVASRDRSTRGVGEWVDPATNPILTSAPSAGGQFRVRMPDNSEQLFSGITPDLDAALKAGGRLLRPDNTIASMMQFGGGWLADNKPLNQWAGGDLMPEQRTALQTAGLLPLNVNSQGNTQQRVGSIIDAAMQAAQGGAATLASGVQPQYQDLLNRLLDQFQSDAGKRDQLLSGQLGQTNQMLQQIMALGGQGLSPAAKAAMTTNALESVPQQYAAAGRNLMTSLLRSGSANMPKGGDFSRPVGQFLSDQLQTSAGLLRDVELADEKQRQANYDRALQAAGVSGSLASTIANAYDPNRYTQGLLGSAGGLLNTVNSMTAAQFQGLDLATKLTAIGAGVETANLKLPILASILSAGLMGGKDSLIQRGIGGLIDLISGGKKEGSAEGGGDGGTIGGTTGGKGIFGSVWDGLKTIGGAIGGALSSAAGFLASNPWTVGIAGAVAGAAVWLKSQAKWEANTIVQNLEDPFHYEYLSPFVDQFTQAFTSGNMTKEQAQQARTAFLATWDLYQQKANEFGQGGDDEELVAGQSIANLQRVAITPILNSIDAAIAALG